MGEAVRWPQTRALLNARAGRARFEFFQAAPAADLAWFVGNYWIVRWDLRGQPPHRQRVLPHPVVQLTFMAGRRRVAGVLRGPFAEVLAGAGFVVGVAFRPGGFRPLLGAPVSTITDRFLPVPAVLGPDADAATEKILADCAAVPADELPAVATAGADVLLHRLAPPRDPGVEAAAAAVAAIAGDPALMRVAAAADAAGLTPRGLQRMFREYVGVGPKWVIRRYRLHEAAQRAAAGGRVDWAGVAADLGYADQAHFTRDFTATVGMSPARYSRECATP